MNQESFDNILNETEVDNYVLDDEYQDEETRDDWYNQLVNYLEYLEEEDAYIHYHESEGEEGDYVV